MEGSAVDYFRLAYRAVASKPLDYFVTRRELFAPQKDSSLRLGSAEQPFLAGDDTSLAGLVSHRRDKSLDEHFWMLVSGAFGVRRLQTAGYFGRERERAAAKRIDGLTDDESLIGLVLVNILGVMQYNTHAIIECRFGSPQDVDSWHPKVIGSGVYPTLALLNHSCDPNIAKYYLRRGRVVAVASRKIFAGEEVSENYLPHFFRVGVVERRLWLRKHYRFECACVACAKDFPTLQQMNQENNGRRVASPRCPQCGRGLRPEDTAQPIIRCPAQTHALKDVDGVLSSLLSKVRKAKADLLSKSISADEALAVVTAAYGRMCSLAANPCPRIVEAWKVYVIMLEFVRGIRRQGL